MTTPLPPPGWYPDARGWPRWWDGTAWGPVAPPPPPVPMEEAGKTLAILSHLGLFMGWFIVSLVVRLTEGKRNEYVRHHSTEALNFQITFIIVWVVAFFAIFGSTFASAVGHPGSHAPSALVFFPFVMMAILWPRSFFR